MNFKNYNIWDIALLKFGGFFGTLFLISVWSGFADWVGRTHWAWFLAISIIFALKPAIKTWK